MKSHFAFSAIAATLLVAGPAAAATNLIVNGDFETPGNVGAYRTINAGQAPAGFGWTITGSVDVLSYNGAFGRNPPPPNSGANSLDLVGAGSVGGISQSFATEAGKTYRLSFDFSHSPTMEGAAMTFGVAGIFEQALSTYGTNGAWQNFTFDFVADAATGLLAFNNTRGGFWTGMYLDNVSVIDMTQPGPIGGAVPEPATWALMIGGFGMAGAAVRRRRRTILAL